MSGKVIPLLNASPEVTEYHVGYQDGYKDGTAEKSPRKRRDKQVEKDMLFKLWGIQQSINNLYGMVEWLVKIQSDPKMRKKK